MSSLIEQAAHRLAQLRRAGVDMPEPATKPPPPAPARDEARPAEPAAQPAQPNNKVRAAASRRVELDMDALAAVGIVTPNAPRSQIADQYRVIKRPLIGNAMGKGATPVANGNLIMVTSAVPGEGKSFTAVNLAISIAAELDNTVMLVDADVARPSILRMLGLPPGPGLLDLLQDETADVSTMLLKTNIDTLSILPSGTPHDRATEMLASDSMTRLVEDMGKRYPDRIIVFDSPPLLLTTEARVLATHMGQIIMVIHAEKTLRSDVEDALATIEQCPVKLLLLNQVRTSAGGGYGYGYKYGYGYGYGSKVA